MMTSEENGKTLLSSPISPQTRPSKAFSGAETTYGDIAPQLVAPEQLLGGDAPRATQAPLSIAPSAALEFPPEDLDEDLIPNPETTPRPTFHDIGTYRVNSRGTESSRCSTTPPKTVKTTPYSPEEMDLPKTEAPRILTGAKTIVAEDAVKISGALIHREEEEREAVAPEVTRSSLDWRVGVLSGLVLLLGGVFVYLLF